MVLLIDIARAVKNHKSDDEIHLIIQDFVGVNTSAEDWIIENYAELRRFAYPDPSDFLDAWIKINSGNEEMKDAGEKQMHDYVTQCLAVKSKFPKG